jgi:hypothetical protein
MPSLSVPGWMASARDASSPRGRDAPIRVAGPVSYITAYPRRIAYGRSPHVTACIAAYVIWPCAHPLLGDRSMIKQEIKQEKITDAEKELPPPIQLTPDQLNEVAGGGSCVDVIIIRRGLPVA